MGRKRKRSSIEAVDEAALAHRYAGGWRQSAGQVREVVRSNLAAYLVLMWAWGLMSATAVQKQAHLTVADMKAALLQLITYPLKLKHIHTYTNSIMAAVYVDAYYIYMNE